MSAGFTFIPAASISCRCSSNLVCWFCSIISYIWSSLKPLFFNIFAAPSSSRDCFFLALHAGKPISVHTFKDESTKSNASCLCSLISSEPRSIAPTANPSKLNAIFDSPCHQSFRLFFFWHIHW